LVIQIISVTSRTVSFEIINDECYYLKNNVEVYVNNEKAALIDKNVYTLYNLQPNTEYSIKIIDTSTKETSESMVVRTNEDSAVINVKDFGAVGDGVSMDTASIQAAIAACPKNGRIIFPEGKFLTTPIFLKSDICIELEKDAIILGSKNRELYPVLTGMLKNNTSEAYSYLISWEGEPADCFASLITGINVSNISIIGEGIIDGNASFDTWWYEAKKKRIAWRPRTIFFSGCSDILVEGVTVMNSPSWTIHPLLCQNLKFINLQVENPADAPNTDGINPESCRNVLILGVNFSVGDDCIAIKSGKYEISKKYPVPSEEIYIRNCNMQFGHGAVVIGSEMSGGVKKIYIEKCLFNSTDRGIRIKTRRGRGRSGIIDEIYAINLKMNKVQTPFVINSFYFCDEDGKTEYVWSKEKLEVDDRTPYIGNIVFKDIVSIDTQVAAGFMYGLPEEKVASVDMENIYVHFDINASSGYPDMMSYLEPMRRNGFYFNNIKKLKLNNIKLDNSEKEGIIKLNIDEEYISI
jgi:polygalacturonase